MRDAEAMDTNDDGQELTVGAVASLVGVSVRTLHHWDAMGLVRPSGRTWSGYRLYSAEDIARLHRVLVYRETGMPLARIAEVLDDPDADAGAHLTRQRALLMERIDHLHRMVRAVDTMMEKIMSNTNPTPSEQAAIWGTTWTPEYQAEVEKRWGGTEDWAEAERRRAAMTRQDWERARDDTEALEAALVAAKRGGVEPGSPQANDLARRHLDNLNTWFDVTTSKQVLIAGTIAEDPRWVAHYDALEPGLAAWLRDVIDASARAQGIDPQAATWQ
ncbi:MerR family transcriptional regulator [Propionibacterium ruminifibrarum]|nr:MerR family transcriptional regulator [Propionibacterium ruminifibrarum]